MPCVGWLAGHRASVTHVRATCGSSQRRRSFVRMGMKTHARDATTKALTIRNVANRGKSPSAAGTALEKVYTAAFTPIHVTTAIFHLGGGGASPRKKASRP